MMNIKWYVLYVNTGQEHAVAEQLRHRGYDAIVPIENKLIRSKGKWITQPHILFDGYVFVRMDYEWSKYYVFKGIPHIIRLLGGGTSPIPLTDKESEFILTLSELLKTPSVLKFTGEGYETVSGFLAENKDKIVKVQKRYKKATIKITLAGEPTELTVSFTEQKGVTVWVQNLLKVDFANLFVINMYLLTAFVTVFRSFANLNFVN